MQSTILFMKDFFVKKFVILLFLPVFGVWCSVAMASTMDKNQVLTGKQQVLPAKDGESTPAASSEYRAVVDEKNWEFIVPKQHSLVESLIPRQFSLAPGDELIGHTNMQHVVKSGETLMELARVYGMGFNEISMANHKIDPWEPKPGTLLNGSFIRIIPGIDGPVAVSKIIVNIPEMRLYHHWKSGWVETYPIGVGRVGFATPKGAAKLIRKKAGPSWFVPESIQAEKPELEAVVPPGPENPLGSHALYLSIESYLLHGTNKPLGIGRRVSHGCIRLYPEDITVFFKNAKVGAEVMLVHEPVKAGWRADKLYIEAYPLFAEEMDEKGQKKLHDLATTVVGRALERRPELVVEMDWGAVDRFVAQPDGMPHPVGQVLF
jgi:L,D-transpeptidase ErfK/SrfK